MPSRGDASKRGPQWLETAGLDAWSQRRGRPGITPEFPVCPWKKEFFSGPPDSAAESTGCAGAVKQTGLASHNRQGLPAVGRMWKTLPVVESVRMKG
jgi:hypothetical protein